MDLKPEVIFGLRLNPAVSMTVRADFHRLYAFVFSDNGASRLDLGLSTDIGICSWHGQARELATFLLQQTILGIEAYVPMALLEKSSTIPGAKARIMPFLDDPFLLRGKSTVDNIYNLLPALVSPKCSLKAYSNALFETTGTFYKEVRNGIFHGKILDSYMRQPMRAAFNHIALLYEWTDTWRDDLYSPRGRLELINLRTKYRFETDA